ncbi:D-ribose pyranase [Enterococcus sp. DIV0876]|uniref:D-ribose pyranase n=1 Tax=Enterococcus sp. DIV0876 TaxID=2774633 RepID=UPI003D2FB7AF
MKKHGILNSDIDKVLADLGHTDQITIGDLGLPIPAGVKKIDVALAIGTPSFQEVVSLMKEEMAIESIILAEEIQYENPDQLEFIIEQFPDLSIVYLTHDDFKKMTHNSKAIIRTGEATPYANIILQSAVIF